MSTKVADISQDDRWGYNPLTRRYLKRTGECWRRLVKAGVVQDEEVAQQLLNSAAGTTRKYVRGQNVVLNATRDTIDTSKLTPSQLQQIAQQMATMNIGVEKKPLSATQRWKEHRRLAMAPVA